MRCGIVEQASVHAQGSAAVVAAVISGIDRRDRVVSLPHGECTEARGPLVVEGIHKKRVACVKRCQVVQVTVELLGLLALLAVGVLLAADDDRVDGNKDGEDTSQNGLHDNENNAGDGLGGLSDAKLFDEHQDADNREHTDDLDDDVDPVARPQAVWTRPEQEDQKQGFDNQLPSRLHKAFAVSTGDNTALCEHTKNLISSFSGRHFREQFVTY